ncbi:MAG TPA: hypothetical protein VFQ76_22025 [Longimicrobiaceae bacterium]|nr:hypothetical protein [Longimicrobiaceae bacterium]
MPNFRITLSQDLPNREPTRFQVVYTYAAAPTNIWWLDNVHPDRDVAVVNGDCAADLINQPNVRTRTLRAHYPTAPNQVDVPISSVQP